MPTLYTVGHSSHTLGEFTALLRRHGVTALADVRSAPYSQYTPQFNREMLKAALQDEGVAYVFLGDQLGARPSHPACYDNDGRVDFAKTAAQKFFREGLERVRAGAEKFKLALMCSEKEPEQCHRMVLVCRNLRAPGFEIRHILEDGALEDNRDTEARLLKKFKIAPSFFTTAEQDTEEAYDRQARKIAFRKEDETES